jgi:hypothetical protein
MLARDEGQEEDHPDVDRAHPLELGRVRGVRLHPLVGRIGDELDATLPKDIDDARRGVEVEGAGCEGNEGGVTPRVARHRRESPELPASRDDIEHRRIAKPGNGQLHHRALGAIHLERLTERGDRGREAALRLFSLLPL